ncbi:MAG: alpha/beta hydrolase [Clostridia bacterium]|nr:alpha/beta hydrolase [Clostridia bacterium]
MGKKTKRLLAAALVLTVVTGMTMYLSGGYDASPDALAAMERSVPKGHAQAFLPDEIRGGLIFYPGGLVDHRAYAPLMQALCDRGVLCLLVQMPLDLAVLDMNAADGLQALYPDVQRWLIGGHSLGGAMAADYAARHSDAFDGLVLLGAYSAADLSRTELKTLSVYGAQDGVLNREKYDECMKHYPQDFEEIVIDGGCHAYFGDYGAQKGDGVPSISRAEQIAVTADAIAAMLD